MSRHETSLPPAYFEERYGRDPDPWRFATSDYEREKYEATLAALPEARYGTALEVGCSIGVFTRQLAGRCGTLLAVDVSEVALDAARERCRDRPHVTFRRARLPEDWPAGTFDLVVLSEVVYYLDRADVGRLADRVRGALAPGGTAILVHWTGETDYPLSGDEAAEAFIADAGDLAQDRRSSRTDSYRLDVLIRS